MLHWPTSRLLDALTQRPHGGIDIGHYAAALGLAERRRRFLTPLTGER